MKPALSIVLTAITIGFVAGIVINGAFDNDEGHSNLPPLPELATKQKNNPAAVISNQLETEIKQLRQMLEIEISARNALQDELDSVKQQVADLSTSTDAIAGSTANQQPNDDIHTATSNSDGNWFNVQALIDSGMNSDEANQLRTFFEQQELDRMILRDQSIREGWDRQKYRDELQAISLRADDRLNQLSDESYDAFLYASGQPNRVEVTSVLQSAQAGSAGIQPGDRIISYDNERIYSGFELRSATSAGDINQSVAIEVERNGEIIEYYLARGPLGIRMNSVSVAPGS